MSWVRGTAVAFVAIELLSVPLAHVPVGIAVVFAALFIGGLLLTRRWRRTGVVAIGVLSLFEAAAVPMYDRTSALEWTLQLAAAAAGVIGAAAAIAVLVRGRRSAGAQPG